MPGASALGRRPANSGQQRVDLESAAWPELQRGEWRNCHGGVNVVDVLEINEDAVYRVWEDSFSFHDLGI